MSDPTFTDEINPVTDQTAITSDVVESSGKSDEQTGPGRINTAGAMSGHYSRCKAVRLQAHPCVADVPCSTGVDEAFNAWAEENKGFLVVDMRPLADGSLLVLYTSLLTEVQLRVLTKFGEEINQRVREEEARMAEAQEAVAAKREAENKRLIELGKRCEQNHKKVKK